ncbi:murein transglycosylase A [Sphingomonas sp. AP4-R1]|uniref:murein transglycosylase A n=1 Tax=Sphingomonas sp. AP4-R1 TaxID=2735134 RepID=UPI001493B2E4|nr:murein transglycosylase A [Sphingomonas sp. AP4-R1]QJU58928.1 murein transglycosylase A [Sphingomonas sp. AP4-R1]
MNFRKVAALAMLLALAACAGSPKPRRPVAPPARPSHPTRPATPPARPQPAGPQTAAELGVERGPAVDTLGLTPENARRAMAAFRTSCPVLVRRTDGSGLTLPQDWRDACDDAMGRLDVDGPAFFAQWFETAIVGDGKAFATGYYEPEIAGSRTHIPGYDTPVYRRPPDLVDVDPGTAGTVTSGKKQRGRIVDGRFQLYHDRAAIEGGALADQGLEIAWARDPIEFFFLQIQGSGRLIQPDGTVMRIGYDGQNGREYVGIGKVMRDRGLIGPGTDYATSMQGMMGWLRGHPGDADDILNTNKSFVFFKELIGAGPLGALGVPVTGRGSVAADPKFIPLGAPILLSLDRPEASGLWVAQDTGGAIKGANRVDTFWGAGVAARTTAGGMSGRGKAWLLLPKGAITRMALRKDGVRGGSARSQADR